MPRFTGPSFRLVLTATATIAALSVLAGAGPSSRAAPKSQPASTSKPAPTPYADLLRAAGFERWASEKQRTPEEAALLITEFNKGKPSFNCTVAITSTKVGTLAKTRFRYEETCKIAGITIVTRFDQDQDIFVDGNSAFVSAQVKESFPVGVWRGEVQNSIRVKPVKILR